MQELALQNGGAEHDETGRDVYPVDILLRKQRVGHVGRFGCVDLSGRGRQKVRRGSREVTHEVSPSATAEKKKDQDGELSTEK